MVASLKGSLKQTFNTMGAGSDEELQADVRNSFGIWTVDPGQVIANEITREQDEELTAGEGDASLPVEQRDRNEQVNEKTQEDLAVPIEKEGENARQLETKKHNLSLQPDGLEKAGLMQNSNAANKGYKSDIEKQRKERDFQSLLQRMAQQHRILQGHIDNLRELAKYYQEQAKKAEQRADELRGEQEKNIEKIIDNENIMRDLKPFLEARKNGKPLEDREKLYQILKENGVEVSDTASDMVLLSQAQKLYDKLDKANETLKLQNDDLSLQEEKEKGKAKSYKEQAEELESKAAELEAKLLELDAKRASNELTEEEHAQAVQALYDAVPEEERVDVRAKLESRNEELYQDTLQTNRTVEKTAEKNTTGSMDDFLDEDLSASPAAQPSGPKPF